jgi:four helix bundle protein
MRDFHDLRAWQRAHELTKLVYRATDHFPRTEQFGLTSQLRRSAASIAAALAEGCGLGGGDFARFCQIAMGSACETEYHLELARDLGLLSPEEWAPLNALVVDIKRKLVGLLRSPQMPGFARYPKREGKALHPSHGPGAAPHDPSGSHA